MSAVCVLVLEVLASPVGELFCVPLTTAETAKVRRRVVVFCWRATRARDWRWMGRLLVCWRGFDLAHDV